MADRLNRVRLVDRAAALSDEIGLDALTITLVAKDVGIAAPGVYRHVRDIDDLRRAIGFSAAVEAAELLSTATSGRAGSDAIVAIAWALHDWAIEHPGRYAALQIAPNPADAGHVHAAERLVATIASALRAYDLSDEDVVDAVRMLRSLLHGYITLDRAGGFKMPQDHAKSFDRMVRSMDVVLRSWRADAAELEEA